MREDDIMGRKMVSVETLHGYSLEELSKIKNNYKNGFGSTMLSIIINRYEGVTTDEKEDPLDYGFESSIWTISMLIDIIKEKYDKQYSYEWIRRVVKNNNYTYKRGQYKPTYASKEEQELFKKNARNTRCCRKFY